MGVKYKAIVSCDGDSCHEILETQVRIAFDCDGGELEPRLGGTGWQELRTPGRGYYYLCPRCYGSAPPALATPLPAICTPQCETPAVSQC